MAFSFANAAYEAETWTKSENDGWNGWSCSQWKSQWSENGWDSGWDAEKAQGGETQIETKAETQPRVETLTAAENLEKIQCGLVGEKTAEVVIHNEDPMSAYLAAKTWQDLQLSKEIMDGIFEMGFTRPSKIQEVALPITMAGRNLVGQAQNGSGKTAAFSLAMINACDVTYKNPQAICLCPTRELARQNHDVLEKLGKYTGLTQYLAIPQTQGSRPPITVDNQIICGTPGKFHDLLKKRIIDGRYLRIFVLDEADVMINEENQMGAEVCRIRKLMPEVQVLLFSATWPDAVQLFANKMVPNATKIEVKKEDLSLATISQMYVNCGRNRDKKIEILCDLYSVMNIGQSIIFVNSRKDAFDLATRIKAEGHAVSLICGTQKVGPEKVDTAYRDKVMDEFRRGVTKVLISTDVLSRGIDVPAVTLVVNFQLPVVYGQHGTPETETYMHRIGRTGRFGLRGIAINIVTDDEMSMLAKIKSHYSCTIEELPEDPELLAERLRKLR